jgi:putative NADPH-quinone reductase
LGTGRDTYNYPYYPYGSPHGYHDEVWTDGHGNYEYRDNGGVDPNVGSDRTWTLMHKREVNG